MHCEAGDAFPPTFCMGKEKTTEILLLQTLAIPKPESLETKTKWCPFSGVSFPCLYVLLGRFSFNNKNAEQSIKINAKWGKKPLNVQVLF